MIGSTGWAMSVTIFSNRHILRPIMDHNSRLVSNFYRNIVTTYNNIIYQDLQPFSKPNKYYTRYVSHRIFNGTLYKSASYYWSSRQLFPFQQTSNNLVVSIVHVYNSVRCKRYWACKCGTQHLDRLEPASVGNGAWNLYSVKHRSGNCVSE